MSQIGDLLKAGIESDGKNITVEGNVRASNIYGTRGKIWYVHSGVGSDVASRGKLATKPFATVDYAIGKCTANRGDIIRCLPGHAETLATAGAIASDVDGVSVVGVGNGADIPTFTFSAVDATWAVSGASNLLKNLLIKPSIDSVVSPIVVSGADCEIDVEIQDKNASIECVCGILTTAAADRLTINLKYRGFIAGGACENAICLVGVDTARVNVDFYGVASIGVVQFLTTACHDVEVTGKFYNHGGAVTGNVVDTVNGSTWSADGWDGVQGGNFSGGSGAALAIDDVSAIGVAVGTIDTVVDTIKSDLIVLDAIVDTEVTKTATIASDLVVLDAIVDTEVTKTTTIASDLVVADALIDTIKSDLVVLDAIVDGEVTKTTTIASDLVIMDALIDTVKSDLIILDAIVDGEVTKTTTIASDLILVDTVVDTVASDLIILDAIVDGEVTKTTTIASDLVVVDALIDTVKSDLIVLDAIVDGEVTKTTTIASDLVVADAIVDTIASDLVVLDAIVDSEVTKTTTIASDLVVADALIDTIKSDLIVLDAIVDGEVTKTATIASDLVVLDAIVDGEVTKTATIASDLVVADAIIDTVASDLVVADAIIDTIASDLILVDAVVDAQPRCVEKSDGTVPSGTDDLFTVGGGPVRAKIVGVVTTVVDGAVNGRLQITTTTPSATVELNAGAVAMTLSAGTSYRNVGATSVFTNDANGAVILDPAAANDETQFLLPIGTVKFLGDAARGGNIKWYITYWPLSPSSVVDAAA